MAQLLDIKAPLSSDMSESGSSLFVKGFASVATIDRSGDYIDPVDFKIQQFMAAPTLLLNHKFWIDGKGNGVAVGRVAEGFPASLQAKDTDTWNIIKLEDGTVANTFPKSKTPNLHEGARGLFVVAEVTEPDVISMVKDGQLSAFSWRGFVEVSQSPIGVKANRSFKNIDLMEISLVNMPDNPDAVFVIGKSAGLNAPLVIHAVNLDRTRFESLEASQEYLRRHGFSTAMISEKSLSYSALQNSSVDPNTLTLFEFNNGVTLVAGAEVAKTTNEVSEPVQHTFVPVSKLIKVKTMANSVTIQVGDAAEVKKGVPNKKKQRAVVSSGAGPAEADMGAKAQTTATPLISEPGLVNESGLKMKSVDELANAVAEKVASAVSAAMAPAFEKLADVLKNVAAPVGPAQAPAAPVAPASEAEATEEGAEEEVAESTEEAAAEPVAEAAEDDAVDVLAKSVISIADKLDQMQDRLVKIQTGSRLPVRDEQVSKSVRNQDLNSVFDSVLFGQFGR